MKKNIVVDGQLINYYQFGNGSKNLIFLHGWRSSSLIWLGLVIKLNLKDLSIYCLDLPGFGQSPAPKNSFSVQDYGDIVSSFVEKLNLKRVVLVGHSFGGRIVIKLAATKPNIIEKIILIDSAGIKTENRLNNLAKLVKPFFKPKFMQKLKKSIYKKIGAEDYLVMPELKETFVKVINEDLASYLSDIKQPTLIIWGENDDETPLKFAEIMHDKIKNSKLEILKNAGHFSFIDQPRLFLNEINNFIQ